MQSAATNTPEGGDIPKTLHPCLSALDLTLLGIGAIIGAGIFVITGIAAATQAGPAIVLSYILAGLASVFCALAYAELASSVGGCGSAYGYAYAGIGRFAAWIIGWDLLMEYGMNTATISIGWSGYVDHLLSSVGLGLPTYLTHDPFSGGIVNLPAMLIIMALAWLLTFGTKKGAMFNNIIVYIKLLVISLFVVVGLTHINSENWHPFLPFGAKGIVNGAGLIFFAFIGFDAVSTAGEEAKNPKRDLPIGILASLIVCTLVYVIVAAVLTGIMPYPELNVSSAVSTALLSYGHKFTAEVVAVGAIAGLTTAILAFYYGFTRVFLAMSRDGFLPKKAAVINNKTGSPNQLIWTAAIFMALFAGLLPITQIANLVNIGTLAAFIAVCLSVMFLRVKKPDMPRPFKMPLNPLFPVLGTALCIYLMATLPLITWISFSIWTGAGIALYYLYSKKSNLRSDPLKG